MADSGPNIVESRPRERDSAPWTIYLAGPMHHCSPLQQTAWRDEFIRRLAEKSTEFRCFNPAQHQETWTPFAEIYDIEQSQLVVANLWRESTGTIAGIIQARRAGKPVVIIDPNYIQSDVLKFYVAKDCTVNSLEAAVGVVLNKIRPRLAAPGTVIKTRSRTQQFDLAKLERSLTAACANAGVNDTLAALVTNELQERFQGRTARASGQALQTAKIKDGIFEFLQNKAEQQSGEYRLWFEESISKIKAAWTRVESKKDPVAREADLEERLGREQEGNTELRGKLEIAEARVSDLDQQNRMLLIELGQTKTKLTHLQREYERLQSRAHNPPTPPEPLERTYRTKFPNLEFSPHALKRLGDYSKSERTKFEKKLRLINGGDRRPRCCVEGTEPKVREQYASEFLRIYFTDGPGPKATIALVGDKKSQPADMKHLRTHPSAPAEKRAPLAASAAVARN